APSPNNMNGEPTRIPAAVSPSLSWPERICLRSRPPLWHKSSTSREKARLAPASIERSPACFSMNRSKDRIPSLVSLRTPASHVGIVIGLAVKHVTGENHHEDGPGGLMPTG